MYDKYKIVASANCKDQVGTDGFTLWGGYWNQAYYPSRLNAYMPAQHADKQIQVPVFRMLGSDPIRQYADGSTVTTLEPVYPYAGGNESWINWFFRSFSTDPTLGFNYTQAGQENSFTWDAMKKGLEIQFPIIAHLKEEGKVRAETMAASGLWFQRTYKVTPATTFSVTKDLNGSDQKTIWYDSRFYRLNILWKNGNLQIRDIHLFNENVPDKYLNNVTTVNQSFFYTLPVVDGFQWGKRGQPEGMRLMTKEGGHEVAVHGGNPIFSNTNSHTAQVSWPVDGGGFEMDMKEDRLTIKCKTDPGKDWFLDLYVAENAKTPLQQLSSNYVLYQFDGHAYRLVALQGSFEKVANGSLYRIKPAGQTIILKLSDQ